MSARLRVLLVVLVALISAVASTAAAAALVQHAPLRRGDHGPRVRDIQWLLSGHKPSVRRHSIRTYGGKIDGQYGIRTARAVKGAKYQLGYPMKQVNGRAGKQLFQFMLGRRKRPLLWIARAGKRKHSAVAGQTSCSRRIITLERSQLGVTEVPWGSNAGTRVHVYQRVTGAYNLAWCASFQQWGLLNTGQGTIAGASAYVPTIRDWAYRHSLLHALPRPGSLVIYLRELWGRHVEFYHIGLVESVTKNGFFSLEGNSGNAVRRRFHPTGYRLSVFVWLPCRAR